MNDVLWMVVGARIAPLFLIDNSYVFVIYELFIEADFMFYEYSVLIPGELDESFMVHELRIVRRRISAKANRYLMISYGGVGYGKGITEEDFLFWKARLG